MCGGIGPANAADDDIKALCVTLKAELEAKADYAFSELTVIHYKSQLVAGKNYFVKIHTGDEKYVHARIYQPLPGQGNPEVHSVKKDKSLDVDIEYF